MVTETGVTETGDLSRLRRAAAAGLRRAASAFDDAIAGRESFPGQALPSPSTQRRAATDTSGGLRSARLFLDNELDIQELVNLLLPAIENALRNRRDIGAP